MAMSKHAPKAMPLPGCGAVYIGQCLVPHSSSVCIPWARSSDAHLLRLYDESLTEITCMLTAGAIRIRVLIYYLCSLPGCAWKRLVRWSTYGLEVSHIARHLGRANDGSCLVEHAQLQLEGRELGENPLRIRKFSVAKERHGPNAWHHLPHLAGNVFEEVRFWGLDYGFGIDRRGNELQKIHWETGKTNELLLKFGLSNTDRQVMLLSRGRVLTCVGEQSVLVMMLWH